MTTELFVVPSERQVERLAREGKQAETRGSLAARLAAALLPDVRFADPRETRLTLGVALETARGQLDLFGAEDPLLAPLRGRGGASWVRAVTAIDEAIGALRIRGATEAHLERVRGSGVASARARTLAAAMRALDETLARAGACDGRLLGAKLAPAIRAAGADVVRDLLGTDRVRARWLLRWDLHDLVWWRALDETLARAGHARIVLPAFDQRLEGARERGPLETLADVVARHLDAAPELETIPAVLGDLGATAPRKEDAARVRLVRVADARAQARAVSRIVKDALAGGQASVERVAIAYPSWDERTLVPLRRALEAEHLVVHESLGAPPSSVPVVAAALHALVAAESLERGAVARLLRSGYLDAPRVVGLTEFREAERVLTRLARALETRATAAGPDELERLVRTAAGRDGEDAPRAREVFAILGRARGARTRGERVRAARALFQELGFASRAGRGALATFARDEAPSGVDRAERLAVARDVRAWNVLEAALDAYETVALRAGASARPLDAEVFRLELTELLDRPATMPGAGRAGAVRILRLADVAGEALDLLVVVDTNDGVLPRDVPKVTLVSEALESSVARAARDAFFPVHATELAARELAALAVGAADAAQVVLLTTAEDGGDAVAAPARVFAAIERAGIRVEDVSTDLAPHVVRADVLTTAAEITRRATRERAREGFFLDPTRAQSDVVGRLEGGSLVAGVVERETGRDRERALAVTSIERFAQCAFRGYAHVVLAAREGEEQRELPDAREEGNLGHAALAAAFQATRELWPARPRENAAILERGLAAADSALDEAGGHAPLRAIVRLRVRESVRAVLLRGIADTSWDFALAEQAFGTGKPWPAFEVAPDLWLRGSIDRVDQAHGRNAVRVIDYKRSKSTVRDSSGRLGETALQIPIYALVAGSRLEASATGIYLPMQPRDLADASASTRAEEAVTALARREGSAPAPIAQRVLALAVEARAGRFAPLPARDAECTYCSVSGGCRKPRFAMAPAEDVDDKEAP